MIHHKLAYEIASALGDTDNLKVHEDFTETYLEEFLRNTLNKVMSIPERKIKKRAWHPLKSQSILDWLLILLFIISV